MDWLSVSVDICYPISVIGMLAKFHISISLILYGLVSGLCHLSMPHAASEQYCHELKLQLQRSSQQVEELQQRLTATQTELETAREQLQNYKDGLKHGSAAHLLVPATLNSTIFCCY